MPTLAAAEPGGTVSGSVVPATSMVAESPERNRGFLQRAANPLKPPRPFNPLPHLVVILEGGSVAPDDQKPPREPVRYSVIGESFDRPVLPVVTGSAVELRNDGKGSVRLYAPAQPELIAGDPINPKGVRLIKKLDLAFQAIEIRDHDSPHISAWLVGVPHPYFARVDEAGKFQIRNVPPGEWKVRLWFRGGWLSGVSDRASVVVGKDTAIKLVLPAKLEAEPAGVK